MNIILSEEDEERERRRWGWTRMTRRERVEIEGTQSGKNTKEIL